MERSTPAQPANDGATATVIAKVSQRLLAPADALLATAAGLLAGLVYWLGSAPGVLFGDGGELQFAAWLAGLPHPTGYPLYMLLGWAWTHGLAGLDLATPARAMNLLSVVFAALTVSLTYLLAHALVELSVTGAPRHARRLASFLAALAFAFTPTFWSQAVVTEVYALNAAFVALILGLAIRWQKGLDRERSQADPGAEPAAYRTWPSRALLLLAFVVGLSLAHHRTTLLLVPVLVIFVWRQDGYRLRRPRWLVPLALAMLVPLLLYVYVPLRVNQSPYLLVNLDPEHVVDLVNRSPRGLVGYILGRNFAGELQGPSSAMASAPSLLDRFVAELTPVGLGLALLGVGYLAVSAIAAGGTSHNVYRRLLWLTGGSFLVLTAFNLFYAIEDIAVFYIPSYLIMTCWIAIAAAFTAREVADLVHRLRPQPPGLSRMAGSAILLLLAALPLQLFLGHAGQVDRSGHTRPQAWWDRLLEADPAQDAVLVSNDRDEIMPLWYLQQVDGRRPDLTGLFPGLIPGDDWEDVGQVLDNALASNRPTYLVKPMPGLEVKVALGLNDSAGLTPVLGPAATRSPDRPQDILIGDEMRLVGYDVNPVQVQPGQTLTVDLYWQPTRDIPIDLTSFVHLRTEDGTKLSQSDTLVGGVYYPTSLWKPGEVLLDRHQLTVPPDAPPGPYELFAGMYELVGQEARTIGSRLLSGRVGGEAQPQTPQTAPARPTYANFNDEILLIGYDVAGGRLVALDGRPQTASQDVPPDEVRIQLLWQAAQPMSRDYTVFVHLVDPAAGIVAQLDAQPFDGDYPTSVWQQGELLTDTLVVQLPRELQPGEYTIMVGLYDAGTASQSRLPAYDDGGQRLSNDRVSLVQISLE